ncbi:YrhK family protein [Pseudodesulfovibrio methanolicus]|uniref:YrhK family protein n=1 Tax=Pseudodesulfovibrio methanolicus TaxID=3126690 RepID=A0ABZ2IUL7_9BACT
MPHMFANRPRLYNPLRDSEDAEAQFRWATVNAVLYKAGGLVFILGSVLFFPSLQRYSDIGAWTFLAGSLLYLVVTAHDYFEVRRNWRRKDEHTPYDVLERVAASGYLLGTLLFTVGSVLFLNTVDRTAAGAWCFILGSLLFVVGSGINILQILRSDNIVTMQLMNLTAVSFVVGSVLFMVASIPYLWDFQAQADRVHMFRFLAWQYLAGSVLFFMGGVFDYRRACVLVRETLEAIDEED